MKAPSILLVVVLITQIGNSQTSRQGPRQSSDGFTIKERGPHHRVWERTVHETAPDGRQVSRQRAYTELATGMHYLKDGKWEESREDIELFQDGAIARHGQHKVIFAPNLATEGAIDVETASGVRLRSHVLGLSYFDTASGKSVLIAEVKDCVGEVEPPNVVIYRDAFTDINADVRYIYTRSGLEQDVILRESPVPPEKFGLNPQTTHLQVLTEFVNPPVPQKTTTLVNDRADETLEFGQWRIVPGKAYSEPSEEGMTIGGAGLREGTPVNKQWRKLDGRDFLIEEVPIKRVESELQALPEGQASHPSSTNTTRRLASARLSLPPKPKVAGTAGIKRSIRIGEVSQAAKGFVMDYSTVGSSLTDYTFKSDSTYYISGGVNLYNKTIFEGGTVLKFTNLVHNGVMYLSQPFLDLHGTVDCQTGPYRPAVFTAKDDNSVGETINGSTGSPSWLYAYTCLSSVNPSQVLDLHDLRMAYAAYGIRIHNSTNLVHSVRNCQFLEGYRGVYFEYSTAKLQNLLFYRNAVMSIFGRGSTLSAEHLTFNQVFKAFEEGTMSLTNSLLVLVTNWPTGFTSFNNVTSSSPSSVFQTVGAGAHYLATNSIYRNVGTTNISPSLLTALRNRTTYPPVIQSNVTVVADTTLSPTVQRDTDVPDLGYHYDPLDYIAYAYAFTNCTLTINPGTAIAFYYWTGLWMQDGATIISEGTPLAPIRLAQYQTVQEQPMKIGASTGQPVNPYRYGSVGSPASFRFTEFCWLAPASYNFYISDSSWKYSNLVVKDCFLGGGYESLWVVNNVTVQFHNNVLFRNSVGLTDFSTTNSISFRNNLFWGGTFYYDSLSDTPAIVKDNAFDATTIVGEADPAFDHGYNAYINSDGRIYPTNANDVVLSSFRYTNGPLGSFYQVSTNLIDEGSRTADLAGLYHYTTRTNQVKETNSVVDIGFHYVAVDANGNPVDTDGDGISDPEEDLDGDGVFDPADGESPWDCVSFPSGLLAWWPGNNHPNDLIGTNHGTLLNGAGYTAGKVSGAFDFDGVNDHVLVTNAVQLNPTTAITLEAWIYPRSTSGAEQDFVSKDGESANRQYLMNFTDENKIRVHVWTSTGLHMIDSGTSLSINTWYHVAMTYDGASLKAYINGVLDITTSANGTIVTTTQPVRIGGGAPTGESQLYFNGLVDEVALYGRALSAAEIRSLYDAGTYGRCGAGNVFNQSFRVIITRPGNHSIIP